MSRFRWPLLILVVCLPLLVLAAGYRLPGLNPSDFAVPADVPAGDFELAWFNTTTGGGAWERFVTGVRCAPGLAVDDSHAFPGAHSRVPEVVVGMPGKPSKLRVRWYKLSGEHSPHYWTTRLAARNPAPLAVIGGGSSDRARDLACALHRQESWHGERPLFFMTTATAESVELAEHPGEMRKLLSIYPGRTFRVCFSNRQMAEAMLDFVWSRPELRPQALAQAKEHDPTVFRVAWDDDPFSSDLLEQFNDALPAGVKPRVVSFTVPFSVGSYSQPNRAEAEAAQQILAELQRLPDQRALLILPTVPAPARRLLRTLCDADPEIGRRLVVLNGDGMGVNTVLRDGEYLWPVGTLPVPLVLFTHANPMGYDDKYLKPPSSTEDVLHTAELMRIIAKGVYVPTTVNGADALAKRLLSLDPPFFDAEGNRRGGTGEYLLVLKPLPSPTVEVWMRQRDPAWVMIRSQPLK